MGVYLCSQPELIRAHVLLALEVGCCAFASCACSCRQECGVVNPACFHAAAASVVAGMLAAGELQALPEGHLVASTLNRRRQMNISFRGCNATLPVDVVHEGRLLESLTLRQALRRAFPWQTFIKSSRAGNQRFTVVALNERNGRLVAETERGGDVRSSPTCWPRWTGEGAVFALTLSGRAAGFLVAERGWVRRTDRLASCQ